MDLDPIIEAACQTEARRQALRWDKLSADARAAIRDKVRPIIVATAPLMAERALRDAAREVRELEGIGRTRNADLSREQVHRYTGSGIHNLWAGGATPRPLPAFADWLSIRAQAAGS